jgi:hypothetical protein
MGNDEYIYLDGQRVPVTRNLWCVLWYLRRKADWHHWNSDARISEFIDIVLNPDIFKCVCTRDAWLWVDALCINQSNMLEQNEQVGKMMQIFRKAISVHTWLGPGCPDLDLALNLVHYSTFLNRKCLQRLIATRR